MSFLGPCKGPIEFFIQGTLQGPEFSGKGDSWITFERVDRLALYGGGTFDGIAKYGSSLSDGCNGKFCTNLPIVSYILLVFKALKFNSFYILHYF